MKRTHAMGMPDFSEAAGWKRFLYVSGAVSCYDLCLHFPGCSKIRPRSAQHSNGLSRSFAECALYAVVYSIYGNARTIKQYKCNTTHMYIVGTSRKCCIRVRWCSLWTLNRVPRSWAPLTQIPFDYWRQRSYIMRYRDDFGRIVLLDTNMHPLWCKTQRICRALKWSALTLTLGVVSTIDSFTNVCERRWLGTSVACSNYVRARNRANFSTRKTIASMAMMNMRRDVEMKRKKRDVEQTKLNFEIMLII